MTNETEAPLDPNGYAANRKILRDVAQALQEDTEIDIDQLIPLIDRASAAYKICRERIEQVELALAEKATDAESGFAE